MEYQMPSERGHRTVFVAVIAAVLSGCAGQGPGIVSGANGAPPVAQSAAADPAAPLGARVLAYAQGRLGKVVGGGECAELADQALVSSGARSASDYTRITSGDDYVWGSPVKVADTRPGDVLQFQNFTVSEETRTAAGGYDAGQVLMDHHTAIVEENHGGFLMVLDQNLVGDPPVRLSRLYVASGTFSGGADGSIDGSSVTTVQVKGQIHAYRPQAAAVCVRKYNIPSQAKMAS
jgi:hypothetical protein